MDADGNQVFQGTESTIDGEVVNFSVSLGGGGSNRNTASGSGEGAHGGGVSHFAGATNASGSQSDGLSAEVERNRAEARQRYGDLENEAKALDKAIGNVEKQIRAVENERDSLPRNMAEAAAAAPNRPDPKQVSEEVINAHTARAIYNTYRSILIPGELTALQRNLNILTIRRGFVLEEMGHIRAIYGTNNQ